MAVAQQVDVTSQEHGREPTPGMSAIISTSASLGQTY
jgi:hypothetical protein